MKTNKTKKTAMKNKTEKRIVRLFIQEQAESLSELIYPPNSGPQPYKRITMKMVEEIDDETFSKILKFAEMPDSNEEWDELNDWWSQIATNYTSFKS